MPEPATPERGPSFIVSPTAGRTGATGPTPRKRPAMACWGRWCAILLTVVLTGCSSYGIVRNQPEPPAETGAPYALKTWAETGREQDFVFILAFSGGGTRAAAMAYGILEELRDTPVLIDGREQPLLDSVTHISSVSGGSFTAAYYGLYGDRIFDDFRDDFLLKDVQGALTRSLFVPTHWFGRKGRTDRTIDYYNEILFHDATFGDMMNTDRPMIVINASDLAYGTRFSFIQNYFDLLCSDLLTFPVADAVAASSAVPGVFNPVVVENFPGCKGFEWPGQTAGPMQRSDELAETVKALESFSDKESRKYIHFVDGGITDNMGLRAMSDIMALSGGPRAFVSRFRNSPPRHIVFISVNASTNPRSEMNHSTKSPSILETVNAMSDIQLHRYNSATVDHLREDLEAWTTALSTADHQVNPYFIEVRFEEVPEPQLKLFLNQIPTSFKLAPEQVDALVETARSLLRNDPGFQDLLEDLGQP